MRGTRKYIDEGFENPLLKRNDWYDAALDAFSKQPFEAVALNQILKAAKINKGSFYFKFYDKLDLYLCMMERGGLEKSAFLSTKLSGLASSEDFFEQLRQIALGSFEFARHDWRFYTFWRTYLADSELIKKTVRETFPGLSSDFMGGLIDAAIARGQISSHFDKQFVHDAVNLYFLNMDAFIDAEMTDQQIMDKVGQVIQFLKSSLAS